MSINLNWGEVGWDYTCIFTSFYRNLAFLNCEYRQQSTVLLALPAPSTPSEMIAFLYHITVVADISK